ncbi:hypothetical protein BJX65DRAFT_144550 [Aspergillus insuetus]
MKSPRASVLSCFHSLSAALEPSPTPKAESLPQSPALSPIFKQSAQNTRKHTTVLSETEASLKTYKYPSESSQAPFFFFFSSSSHSLIPHSLSNLLYNLLLDANTYLLSINMSPSEIAQQSTVVKASPGAGCVVM